MSKVERPALGHVLGSMLLWMAWLEIGEGTSPPSS
jgi:hypothetical protein